MPLTAVGKTLDLSKLTDDEAQHVWAVVQRDFDLRKKEEDRLGDLKNKIEREDTKRELLGSQTSLTESYCIRCLQPFKFLLNTRRQCLDCQLYICKSCSRYNNKEHGWVCDPCHMARVLKTGTLEWYHENVRTRFKRFGSAKVMRSLFKRLSGQPGEDLEDGYEERSMDAADSPHYKEMKKSKRRLTVDPFDFEPGCDYIDTRQQSHQTPNSEDFMESVLARPDIATVFHQILEEQNKALDQQDDFSFAENRTIPSRSVSRLSGSSGGSGGTWGPRYSSNSFANGPDDSEGDDERSQSCSLYPSHLASFGRTSQESLSSANPPPQFNDLNRQVSAVESFLNHLEEKITSTYEQEELARATPSSTSPVPQWEEADFEEQQLRQRLNEMADNISNHSLTSDDEEEEEEEEEKEEEEEEEEESNRPQEEAKPSRIPTRPTSRASVAASRLEEEQTNSEKPDLQAERCPSEEGSKAQSFKGSTALLFELEDKIAQAAADVQNAQSEVFYIEDRIAALNAAGMPGDKRRRSAIPVPARRLSHNFPTNQADRFVRNTVYRGSLTQRTPVAKPKTRSTAAKPVMRQGL
ncbi:melanophilin-like [Nelusetta ayraudi]|uniref:melanophilin-like n=1 Tax=Nelusetta ayraudi TaxID=303726 RepID=UPI003F6EE31E